MNFLRIAEPRDAEILAAIGGKQADHILQRDHRRFFRHFIQHPQPLPEQAAARGGETSHLACQRKILTGETGPDDVPTRNLGALDLLDGAEVKMVIPMIRGVHGRLLRTNVIRPNRRASMLHSLRDQPAASKKINEGGLVGAHEFN